MKRFCAIEEKPCTTECLVQEKQNCLGLAESIWISNDQNYLLRFAKFSCLNIKLCLVPVYSQIYKQLNINLQKTAKAFPVVYISAFIYSSLAPMLNDHGTLWITCVRFHLNTFRWVSRRRKYKVDNYGKHGFSLVDFIGIRRAVFCQNPGYLWSKSVRHANVEDSVWIQ